MNRFMRVLSRLLVRSEALVKGAVFDCRVCGQCLLDKTGRICPMSCPKGLRNGPCGGTLGDRCEVLPDRECVWIRIHRRSASYREPLPPLNPTADAALAFTSSYLNRFTGRDKPGTDALTYPALPRNRVSQPVQTASRLEAVLKAGHFVHTCEVRTPRNADFARLERDIAAIGAGFHAVNATAFLNGRPSLPSSQTCRRLLEAGLEPINQLTARDVTRTTFVSELISSHAAGVHNVLCLTGDACLESPRMKQVFDMDSSLMLLEARRLREGNPSPFVGKALPNPPKPFLGAAINPFTAPLEVPIRRLKQKAAAGADFVQTQLIFDIDRFSDFMSAYRAAGLQEELFLIAGVPVVISASALAMIPTIPGVHYPSHVRQFLEASTNLRADGIEFARQMVKDVSRIEGVRGVHLMLFGSDHSVLPTILDHERGTGTRR